ncbi:ABC transporter ATP-binding protein [Candidatus Saccharibacteria bacterium]|nr:ABC transporter ATP-binding protein [Candidatus Saccharibacteria bacterium]
MIVSSVNLTKIYGDQKVLNRINLAIPDNSIYGLVGPNGAGKTTLLSIMAGLRDQTSGKLILEIDRRDIAICPDIPVFEPWLNSQETLQLASRLSQVPLDQDRAYQLLEMVGLNVDDKKYVGSYSRRMTQRLALASVLAGNPRLIILDEPSSSLDPQGRSDILSIIRKMSSQSTVVFSSHNLSDVQEICDKIGVLNQGKLIYQGDLRSLLKNQIKPSWKLTVKDQPKNFERLLKQSGYLDKVEKITKNIYKISANSIDRVEKQLPMILSANQASLVAFEPVDNLEQAFFDLISGASQ